MNATMTPQPNGARLDYLDAVRAFALLLGIVFHASLSFLPVSVGWAVMDVSTSPLISGFIVISHSFRMAVFFLIAGYFARLSLQRRGGGAFLKSRTMRLVVPFVVGWFILRPLIISGWIMGGASLRGDVDIRAGLIGGFQSLNTLPDGVFTGTHLWFIYYLIVITAATLVLRALLKASGPWHARLLNHLDAALARLAHSRFSLAAFVVPTIGLLWLMDGWGIDTPDRSLLPHIPVTMLYGGCFLFGWMLHRSSHLLPQFARLSAWRWVVVCISCAATVYLSFIQGDPSHPHYAAARLGYLVSYAVMMWLLVFLTLGLFQRLVRRQIPGVRFVADSSYWMYLIHLPIVIWLQIAVAEIPLHWTIKLIGVSGVTILLALLSYDLVVRSTVIGRILNGRRRERVIFAAPVRARLASQS